MTIQREFQETLRPIHIIASPAHASQFMVCDVRINRNSQLATDAGFPLEALDSGEEICLVFDAVQKGHTMSMEIERVPYVERVWWKRVLIWLRLRKPYVEPVKLTFMASVVCQSLE